MEFPIRELQSTDFDKKFLNLLSMLSDTVSYDQTLFIGLFNFFLCQIYRKIKTQTPILMIFQKC